MTSRSNRGLILRNLSGNTVLLSSDSKALPHQSWKNFQGSFSFFFLASLPVAAQVALSRVTGNYVFTSKSIDMLLIAVYYQYLVT